jgi:hypothetical protein
VASLKKVLEIVPDDEEAKTYLEDVERAQQESDKLTADIAAAREAVDAAPEVCLKVCSRCVSSTFCISRAAGMLAAVRLLATSASAAKAAYSCMVVASQMELHKQRAQDGALGVSLCREGSA